MDSCRSGSFLGLSSLLLFLWVLRSAEWRQKEKKRFDEIGKTPAADLRNDSYEPEGELVDERTELKRLNYGNAVVGQKKGKEQTVKTKKHQENYWHIFQLRCEVS